MALNFVGNPYSYYNNRNKTGPLFNGFIYVGIPDLDPTIGANQKAVTAKQEDGTKVGIAQPIRTNSGGYAVDAGGNLVVLLVDGNYSIRVNDKQGGLALEQSNVSEGAPLTPDNGTVSYNSLTEAILAAGFSLGDRVYTASYRSSDECDALSITYPDGGGGDYVIEALDSPDGFGNHAVGPNQMTLIDNGEVNAKQFGAVGDGVTDNLLPLGAFVNYSIGNVLTVASRDGGQYAVTSGTLTIPADSKIQYIGDSRIYASGAGAVVDNGTSFSILGAGSSGPSASKSRGMDVNLNGNTGTATNSTLALNRIVIADDDIDASPDANGTKVDGFLVLHNFGGAAAAGGRHAIEGILNQTEATSATSPDRFYVGVAGVAQTSSGDGGTGGTGEGAYFGGNFVANNIGGLWISNLTGLEINTLTEDLGGNEINYHSGMQIVSAHRARGYTIDAAIAISNKSSSTVTWANGINFGSQNGAFPLGTDSRMIVCSAATTIASGFLLPECTTTILDSGDVNLKNDRLVLGDVNSSVEIGSQLVAGSSRLEFYSSGNIHDYDARFICTGGDAIAGNGSLSVEAVELVTRVVRPSTDNAHTLGTASRRWSVVYSATGAINTSDERSKEQVTTISEAERLVAAQLKGMMKKFKYKDAVTKKGDNARWHFGVIAQEVVQAFSGQGLDATEYGIVCFDEWQDEFDADGELTLAAGDRYGIRYDELLCFIISAL
jgi:hypothetical protein